MLSYMAKKNFADVIKVRILKWGIILCLFVCFSGWAQCNLKRCSSGKREAGDPESAIQEKLEAEIEGCKQLLALKMEKGP